MVKSIKKKFSYLFKFICLYAYYIRKITFFKTNTNKTIIICFDGVIAHGGFVDRIKGIISFYEVSKKLNYNFKINFIHPFEFSDFFLPNKYNWLLERKIRFNPFDTKILYLVDQFNFNPIETVLKSNAKTYLVYCNIDHLKNIYPELNAEHLNEIWKSNFDFLFKKTDFLKNELNKLPSERKIVFHSRFTSLMGDFKDSSIKRISQKDKEEIIKYLVNKIDEKSKQYKNLPIYVLSDSMIFLDYVKNNTPYKILEGIPKHVDVKNNKNDLISHTKTLTDFFFISTSEKVYLLKEKRMYMSGYSKYAAIYGNKDFEVIE